MVRTVRVDLEADVGRFNAPVESAKVKTEELDRKVESLDRDLNKIPADSAKAAAALKLLGDETGKAGVKLDDLGKRSTSMGVIDERIAHTRGEVTKLAEEFNRTGNASILGHLFNAQNDLQDLEKLRGRVAGALEQGAADGGREGFKAFMSSIGGVLSTPALGPLLIAALVTAAVGASPAIGAAVVGGVGVGGIVGGIVGQLHDPQVHQAFADIGKDASKTLTESTSSFKQPLIDGAHQVQDALHQMIAGLDWKAASRDVAPLVGGLTSLGLDIMPGLNKMMQASLPILTAMANDLAVVGSDFSEMFDEIARGGRGEQEALRGLLYLVAGLAVGVGGLILGVSKLVEWFVAAGQAVSDFFARGADTVGLSKMANAFRQVKEFFASFNSANDVNTVIRSVNRLGEGASLTADDLAKLSTQLGQTKVTADSLQAAMSGKLFGTIMANDQAILGWHKSLLDLHDTLDKNGRAIDRHTGLVSMDTKAGLDNREAVLQAMTANMQQYQSFIAAGMGADEATWRYNENTGALEKQLRAAGYNQKQIDDMIGSLKNVPNKVSADIAMNGLTAAINNLGYLLAELNNLNGSDYGFTVTEKHVYESDYLSHQLGEHRWGGIYQHAAAGLLRDAQVYSAADPGRYMIAEPATGGEAFVPRFGDYGRSTAILDQAARWYGGRFAPGGAGAGGGGPMVYVTVNAGMGADGAAVGQQIAEKLRPYVASMGGNVQAALGRRGQ